MIVLELKERIRSIRNDLIKCEINRQIIDKLQDQGLSEYHQETYYDGIMESVEILRDKINSFGNTSDLSDYNIIKTMSSKIHKINRKLEKEAMKCISKYYFECLSKYVKQLYSKESDLWKSSKISVTCSKTIPDRSINSLDNCIAIKKKLSKIKKKK